VRSFLGESGEEKIHRSRLDEMTGTALRWPPFPLR
jgi:hypothetical protein